MPDIADKLDPIRKGLLEFAVLTVIASKKVYAADILTILHTTEFQTQEGTLYPLLSRMCREGTVDYDWQESDVGPPRKYYRLTDKGKEQLESLRSYWQKLSKTLKQK